MKRVALVDVPLEKNVVREVLIDGQKFHGSLSAFDFPTKLHVALSERGDLATVDFIYATAPEEMVRQKPLPGGATLHTGRESGRILRMELPLSVSDEEPRFKLEVLVREPLRKLKTEVGRLSLSERPVRRLAHYKMFPDLFTLIEDKLETLRHEQGANLATAR